MENPQELTKKELIEELGRMIEHIEEMPRTVWLNAINHYDYVYLLTLLHELFKKM